MDQRKVSIALVLVYILMVVYSAYALFGLQEKLVYEAQAISITDISNAQPVLRGLYLTIGITLIVGLVILLYVLNNKSLEVIYVEKKEDEKSKGESENSEDDKKTFDISSVKDALSKKAQSEEKILVEGLTQVCKTLEAGVGAFYMVKKDGSKKVLQMNATYAMSLAESQRPTFEYGEGLVGQVGQEEQPLIIDDLPEGYVKIVSGLGNASPTHVLLAPVKYGKQLCGVVEIATFSKLGKEHLKAVDTAFEVITNKLFAKTEKPKAKVSASNAKKGTEKKETKKG